MSSLPPPIFVIGAGRSGSTMFHHVLSKHPDVSWLTGVCAKHPDAPERNRRFMQALDFPIIGQFLDKRLFRGEFYAFWDFYFPGFSEPFRDLRSDDVTPRLRDTLPTVLSNLATSKRSQLVIKITGWPRLGFLRELFPDAIFVHVVRDGRAVVNSLLNVGFWRGWQGPEHWRWGQMPVRYRAAWENSNESFAVLAGIQWCILMDAIQEATRINAVAKVVQVRYEDVCEAPNDMFRRITSSLGLRQSEHFDKSVGQFGIESTNDKWRESLNSWDKEYLNNLMIDHLAQFGYSTDVEYRPLLRNEHTSK